MLISFKLQLQLPVILGLFRFYRLEQLLDVVLCQEGIANCDCFADYFWMCYRIKALPYIIHTKRLLDSYQQPFSLSKETTFNLKHYRFFVGMMKRGSVDFFKTSWVTLPMIILSNHFLL